MAGAHFLVNVIQVLINGRMTREKHRNLAFSQCSAYFFLPGWVREDNSAPHETGLSCEGEESNIGTVTVTVGSCAAPLFSAS